MQTFSSEAVYISSSSSLKEQISKIDAIIDALLTSGLESAGSATYDSYELDDGQSKIKTSYRSPTAIYNAIWFYRKYREDLVNRLNGRVFVFRNAKAVNGGRYV